MNNGAGIELLEEVRKLMELKGENPFKVRAYDKAIQTLADRDDLQERARAGTLTELPGVGKGISDVLSEFFLSGRSSLRDELAASIPTALVELTEIPGLGPKKAMQLIEELGITSLGELEYACRENRLLRLKGFGEKVQQKILEGIAFRNSTRGQLKLADALVVAKRVLGFLESLTPSTKVRETGALRRRMETLSCLEFLVELPSSALENGRLKERIHSASEKLSAEAHIQIQVHFAPRERFGYEWARTTGSHPHWESLGEPNPFDSADEETFYERMKLPFIPPEARETGEEVKLARAGKMGELLPWDGVRGIFHTHTLRSDGTATLEQMVAEAKRLGYSYIGISDHSQSAFYAQGLKADDLKAQEREIQVVREKYPEVRIFWGIESDILQNGSLDYDPATLGKFEFVIASIHSRFNMDREAMTDRILKAIRDPGTRFLGHATGRLLLGRKGYDVDMERIIVEAAKHDVAIEINAHPSRLDIDWRWGPELRRAGTKVSVNPDAHEVAGLSDVHFGVGVARKALLPRGLVVNSRSVDEVERWLKRA